MKTKSLSVLIFLIIFIFLSACGGGAQTSEGLPIAGEPYNFPTADDLLESSSCPFSPDGAGFTSIGGGFTSIGGGFTSIGGGSTPTPVLLHGEYVWNVVVETLINQGFALDQSIPADASTVYLLVVDQFSDDGTSPTTKEEHWKSNDLSVQVVSVDIGNFDTGQVVDATKTIMNSLSQNNVATKFVLNMSWMILPCQLGLPDNLDDYIKSVCQIDNPADIQGVNNLNDITSFLNSFGVTAPEDFCVSGDFSASAMNISRKWLRYIDGQDAYKAWIDQNPDPLVEFLQCFTANGINANCEFPASTEVISVASAGNSSDWHNMAGIDHPFFPGVLDSVVSVSALEPKTDDPNSDSIGPGPNGLANNSNSGEVAMDGRYPGRSGAWTSFAAPRLSVLEAIHLAKGGSSVCQNIFPPLGYVTEAGNNFLNKDLNTASGDHCTSFPGP